MDGVLTTDELTKNDEMDMLIQGVRELRQDLQTYLTTSQKAEKALNGPILCVSMSSDQKAAMKASRHTLAGIIDEVNDRFGRYL